MEADDRPQAIVLLCGKLGVARLNGRMVIVRVHAQNEVKVSSGVILLENLRKFF
jgi:hypothetical protein